MSVFLSTLLIGIAAGIIDIIPMIKMKLDKYAIVSAFVFYLNMPFFILNIRLFETIWWLKGGIIGFIMALPIIIIVAKDDKKSIPPIAIMSLVLGTLIGLAGHYLI